MSQNYFGDISLKELEKIRSDFSRKVKREISQEELNKYYCGPFSLDYFDRELLIPLYDAEEILEALGVPGGLFSNFVESLSEEDIEKIWAGISNPESGIYIVIKSPNKKYEDFLFINPNADARLKKSVTKKYTTFKIPASA